MTSQGGAAGEIALRLAEIATSSRNVRERDTAIMRLLRQRLEAAYVVCYTRTMGAGKAPALRTRASDADVVHSHPLLVRTARDVTRTWLATGATAPCVLDDSRFGGWHAAGCLLGGELAVVALWPADRDMTGSAEALSALAPTLLLALGRGGRYTKAQKSVAATMDAAKASFVSLVSHALRTPLNTLTGFVEIVLDQPVGPLNERQREFLEYARASGQALTQLVEDVTLLSRADEGSLTLRNEPLDAIEIAERALRTLETGVEARGVQLNLRVEGESLTLKGDGERLAHALAKLLENAVKFSPEGGEVILTVTASNGLAHFAVRDDGRGVAPEEVERIFARFYQAEWTAKSHPGGYGLGLAVAKVIAQAHGGEIGVASVPGRGATFTLIVPLNAASANQHAATKIRRGAPGAALRPS